MQRLVNETNLFQGRETFSTVAVVVGIYGGSATPLRRVSMILSFGALDKRKWDDPAHEAAVEAVRDAKISWKVSWQCVD